MDNVRFVYTRGMSESELEQRLREGEAGVLSLARDGDAYGVPIAYDYDGDRVLLRMSDTGDGEKFEFLASTDSACFVVYDYLDERSSWSVLLRGELRERADLDDAEINERFPPFRVFDEGVDEVEFSFYELVPDSVTGRST